MYYRYIRFSACGYFIVYNKTRINKNPREQIHGDNFNLWV